MLRGGISRKGMSPLIATVLLMAFAVALGGMIMTYSLDKVASGDCGNAKVQVTRLCRSADGIVLSLRNEKDAAALASIQVSYAQGSVENRLLIKDSKLAPGQPLENVQISPVSIAVGTPVSLIGTVGTEPNTVQCQEPIYTSAAIENC